ncbi:hypothetical protein [Lysobacter firmicutimachus]|uniref:RiboL-PSP-HEPN domain-containing protein n=1 Tax=Lysobacter firmicutimachus TaxID=1792846 RepID=A0ABU8D6H6_9GAMM
MDDQDRKLRLEEARIMSDELQASLPKMVPAAGLSLESMLPFKATSLRELLIHRAADLAKTATQHLEDGQVVPGAILTRSLVETVAILFCLHRELERFLSSPNESRLGEFLTSSLVGARWEGHPVQSINVLTAIDKVDKEIPKFRASYDALSEYTHPNWSGLLGSYGAIDRENHELHLGARVRESSLRSIASTLSGSLMAFTHYYNLLADVLKDFNDHFESELPK